MSPPLDMPIAISANFLRFELVIALRTAKDIGLEKDLLLRAVEVIEQADQCRSVAHSGRGASCPHSGVNRTYSGQLAMSAYSLPEPPIGYARAAMLAVAFVSDIRQ